MALTVADLALKLASASSLFSNCQLWIFEQSEEWKEFQGGCEELMAFLEFSGHPLTASRVFQGLTELTKAMRNADRDTWLEECVVVQQKISTLLMRLTAISRSWNQIRPDADIPTHPKVKDTPKKTSSAPKRSWTAIQLEQAIQEYRAQRASTIQEFLSVLDDPNASRYKKQATHNNAVKLFGRNAIARALGVKSPKMVGETTAWKALAGILRLPKKGDGGVPRLQFTASENENAAVNIPHSAARAYGGDDNSPPADVILMQKEQKETLRYIHRLATAKIKDAAKQAEALFSAYHAGEMTDLQVRQTVDLTLGKS